MIVRDADGSDAAAICALAAELGFSASADDVSKRLLRLGNVGEPPLVASTDRVVGCVTWHMTPVLHRPQPVGRITMLVVTADARGRGVGKALVEAAHARLRQGGCSMVEVTSNARLAQAHGFYEHLGYERTSLRFAKQLGYASLEARLRPGWTPEMEAVAAG